MTDPSTHPRRLLGAPSLGRLVLWGLAARVVAANLVQWFTQHEGMLCVFPDSLYYWLLASKLRRGEPYEVVEFGDLPSFSTRTPGYPLFLAACQWLFGPRVLPVRLVQSALGAGCVWLIARLVQRALRRNEANEPGGWSLPLVAAALVAFEPYVVANSAFVLSEAVFVPLLLLTQWGLAVAWRAEGSGGLARSPAPNWVAFATGMGWGAAVLVRPAWWLYVPAALAVWVLLTKRSQRGKAVKGAALAALGVALVMSPWWVRNARVYGRFVPTALWMGASLYDGLNPRADGSSDMGFRAEREFWPLGEEAQDALLRQRAVAFARDNPGRVLGLAVVKAGRFWTPWPNAEGFRSIPLAIASALVTLPLFGLMALGAWDCRRDPRALALLALPLAYTFAVHLVFVSSMRYRVPVAVPALGLAAVGIQRLASRQGGRA